MKKSYKELDVELIRFSASDVITESQGDNELPGMPIVIGDDDDDDEGGN